MNLPTTLETASTARPGYEIASFKEAGLPVSLMMLRILVQERKPLGAIEEGVLQAVDAGLGTLDEITQFLGLPSTVMTTVLARLNTSELVNYSLEAGDSKARITLTSKGRAALESASTIVPEEKSLKVCVDMLTRKILFINPRQLFKPREIKDKGWFEVPTASAKRIEVDDIPIADFDKLLNRGESKAAPIEVLMTRRIERRELHFLPCVMIFYRNRSSIDDIAVAFWREDGPSLEHENRFRELDGPSFVGAKLLGSGGAAESKKLLETVLGQVGDVGEELAPVPMSTNEMTPASAAQPTPTLQSIKSFQHPAILKRGLLSSKRRLLIISPWIRDSVVNHDFLTSLEELLKCGVDVHIGYGLVEGDGKKNVGQQKAPITQGAERGLNSLARKYKNFHFKFIGNTHRKTLISDDDIAVVTSFNWLSFTGDSKGRPRDEHGIVIRKKAYIEQQYVEALALIKDGYEGVKST